MKLFEILEASGVDATLANRALVHVGKNGWGPFGFSTTTHLVTTYWPGNKVLDEVRI